MYHKDQRVNECLVASREAIIKMILSAKSPLEVFGLTAEFARKYEDVMKSAVDEAFEILEKKFEEEAE